MRSNSSFFFTLITLAICVTGLNAQTTINTNPEGAITYSLPATTSGNLTRYFSAPLASDPVYTGQVFSVTPTTIAIADSPAPWTAGQFTNPAAPYFVKFLSGQQAGRVILVTANTTNSLTLDTTDHSSQTVPLNATGFGVASTDSFEVFAGDTLASVFGVNTTQSPLVLQGGSIITADTVSIYSVPLGRFQAYYFDTTAGFWKQLGFTANANNVVLYPYSTFAILRRSNEPAISFVLMGKVPEVTRLVKTTGNSTIYDSTGYPVDMTLGQLNLQNWTKGTLITADTVSVWNAPLGRFDAYYQQSSDSHWRKVGDSVTDQNNFVIPAGTAVAFLRRSGVSGSASYIEPTIPY